MCYFWHIVHLAVGTGAHWNNNETNNETNLKLCD